MPAFLHWKYWTRRQRKHKAKKVTTDYVYLQWHFRSQEESTEETYKTYDVVDNIDKTVYTDIQTRSQSQSPLSPNKTKGFTIFVKKIENFCAATPCTKVF